MPELRIKFNFLEPLRDQSMAESKLANTIFDCIPQSRRNWVGPESERLGNHDCGSRHALTHTMVLRRVRRYLAEFDKRWSRYPGSGRRILDALSLAKDSP
jgi:hypothetical protein